MTEEESIAKEHLEIAKAAGIERPVVWLKRSEFGYWELYLYRPKESPAWLEFDSLETMLEWLKENPNALLTREELKADYLQLEFKGFNMKEAKDGA